MFLLHMESNPEDTLKLICSTNYNKHNKQRCFQAPIQIRNKTNKRLIITNYPTTYSSITEKSCDIMAYFKKIKLQYTLVCSTETNRNLRQIRFSATCFYTTFGGENIIRFCFIFIINLMNQTSSFHQAQAAERCSSHPTNYSQGREIKINSKKDILADEGRGPEVFLQIELRARNIQQQNQST